MGLNYGPTFRHLCPKVQQITSADAGEIVVCNAVFRLSISCSVPEIFAMEVQSHPNSRQKSMFFGQNFFGVGPNVDDNKIATRLLNLTAYVSWETVLRATIHKDIQLQQDKDI